MQNNPTKPSPSVLCWVSILSLVTSVALMPKQADPLPSEWDRQIQVFGALRPMMHEGKTGAAVNIGDLLPDPNMVAVGALAELAGEVTIIDGKAYLSYPDDGQSVRTEMLLQTKEAAALLVLARVPDWVNVVLDHDVRFENIDDEIWKLALKAEVPTETRFPYLIEGSFDDLRWHVIDGRRLKKEGSNHRDHLSASVQLSRDHARATLVGFYSTSDQGVFTHMGSRTHIHCVLEDPLSAGHVDHVNIPAGTTIRFPYYFPQ